MKIYLATWLFEPSQGIALTKTRARHRLLSFYHTQEKQPEFVTYLKTGRNDEEVLKKKN